MGKIIISNHSELELRIMQLKTKKMTEENELKAALKLFSNTLSPFALVKDSLHKLAGDKELRNDLKTVGLKIGADFIIDTVLGKSRSVRGFIGSILAEQVAGAIINKNSSTIISAFNQFVSEKKLVKK
ncbi:MAG: hypothetical protein V4565_03225 [Bacteroidota bacterium]